MKIGCFALIDPFSTLEHQLERIAGLGFDRADVTDNGDGAVLGVHFGFTAVASLDAHPHDLARLFGAHGLTITSYCAHANLLDPAAPWRYGTGQIIKAIRAAAAIDVPHVVTTDGDPTTPFGHALTPDQALFTIAEKLYEPLRMANDLGVKVLLEPHGPVTGSIDQLERLLELCDSPALGVNLDTGNLWLAGEEPVEFVRRLGGLIGHVHWKDVPEEMAAERGTRFGFGMSTIPLGAGLVDIAATHASLTESGFDGDTTLEIAGDDAVLASRAYLESLASPSAV